MADSTPTVPVSAVPPPLPPLPVTLPTAPTPPVALKPGWKTTEAWISFLTLVIGVIPSSGLTANAPLLTQIVGMVIAALAALHYTGQRAALKRAALTAAGVSGVSKTAARVTTGLLLLAIAVAGASQISCAGALNCQDPKNASSTSCTIVKGVTDCTGVSSVATGVAVVGPIIDQLIESARQPDGTIKWPVIEDQLVSLAIQYGSCVLAEVWNAHMHSGATPALARSTADRDDFAQEFERIRAQVAPGRKLKVTGGAVL